MKNNKKYFLYSTVAIASLGFGIGLTTNAAADATQSGVLANTAQTVSSAVSTPAAESGVLPDTASQAPSVVVSPATKATTETVAAPTLSQPAAPKIVVSESSSGTYNFTDAVTVTNGPAVGMDPSTGQNVPLPANAVSLPVNQGVTTADTAAAMGPALSVTDSSGKTVVPAAEEMLQVDSLPGYYSGLVVNHYFALGAGTYQLTYSYPGAASVTQTLVVEAVLPNKSPILNTTNGYIYTTQQYDPAINLQASTDSNNSSIGLNNGVTYTINNVEAGKSLTNGVLANAGTYDIRFNYVDPTTSIYATANAKMTVIADQTAITLKP